MHFVGTKLSVEIHQRRTVDNAIELSTIAPDLPWRRVLQGGTSDAYMRCADLYEQAGIDLTTEPLVGLGSVCRRQATGEIADIVRRLRERGITRLHGFGVKTLGLKRYGHLLNSADSLAWSEDARRIGRPVCGTVHPRGGKLRQLPALRPELAPVPPQRPATPHPARHLARPRRRMSRPGFVFGR